MSEIEFKQAHGAFVAGTISRRRFVRRLIAGGVTVTAAVAFAESASAKRALGVLAGQSSAGLYGNPAGLYGNPAGLYGNPAGLYGKPPGQGGTPPGQGGTPPPLPGPTPGQGGTPPGKGGKPPGKVRSSRRRSNR
jgi:hypothetical protein